MEQSLITTGLCYDCTNLHEPYDPPILVFCKFRFPRNPGGTSFCSCRTRNYFSHRSSGPPVRMTCVFGIRVRMRVDLLFYCGEEKRKEYTQDAYNQIYVQKWRPPTAIQIL